MFNVDPQFVDQQPSSLEFARGRYEGWLARVQGFLPQENPYKQTDERDTYFCGWNEGWESFDQAIRRHAEACNQAGTVDPLGNRPLINVAGEAIETLRNMVLRLERSGKFSDALDLRRGLALVEKVTQTIR